MTISFTDWTSSLASCGSFTYTAVNNDGSSLDSSLISFNAATKTFSVQNSNPSYINSYTIKVTGTLPLGA